jgi:hypothetical protein
MKKKRFTIRNWFILILSGLLAVFGLIASLLGVQNVLSGSVLFLIIFIFMILKFRSSRK